MSKLTPERVKELRGRVDREELLEADICDLLAVLSDHEAARPLLEAAEGSPALFSRRRGLWEENVLRAALTYRQEKETK